MFRKTLTAAIAVATISGAALFSTASASQAGYYGGGGYYGGYHYAPSCYTKKVKVWGYYGWTWQRVRVCN